MAQLPSLCSTLMMGCKQVTVPIFPVLGHLASFAALQISAIREIQ